MTTESHSKDKTSWLQYRGWLCLAAILSVAFLLLLPPGNRLSEAQIQQLQSNMQLKGVGSLILMYEKNHGTSRPRRMSELVTGDRSDLIAMFYAPNRLPEQMPIGWQTNKALLDDSSDYSIASYSNIDILAFEKPSLWPDGTVAVCLSNLNVIRINIADFKKLMQHRD
jgi:hypothetical protein